MKKVETELKDCYILEPDLFGDDRGYFTEFYNQKRMEEYSLNTIFEGTVQANRSMSRKGTLRGMHYQLGKSCQAKLVECLQGAVLDIVVDIRKNSPTYKKWISVELTAENHRQLLVPKGFAHGFLTLEDNTIFQYLVDNFYDPSMEDGITWNDSDIGIIWPFEKYGINEPILSEKDKNRQTLKEKSVLFE